MKVFTFYGMINLLTILLGFIVPVLLSFLLLGCVGTTPIYSQVYLARLEFNQTSDLYPRVKAYYETVKLRNVTDLSSIVFKIGYLGTCIEIDETTTCLKISNLQDIIEDNGIPLISQSSSKVNLVEITQNYSNSTHPTILIISIIIAIMILLLLCYINLPLVPGTVTVRYIIMVLSILMTLLWGLGSMLQMTAVTTAQNIIGPASLNLIQLSRGTRAQAMTWTVFSMIFLVTLAIGFMIISNRKIYQKPPSIPHKV